MYYLEKGKSLYGLKRYEEALQALQCGSIIPDYMNHPLDQAWLTTAGAYRALCYVKLNDKTRALEEATKANEMIQAYPDSTFSEFIKETLQIIQKF